MSERMTWISKTPPIYYRNGDIWLEEGSGIRWYADVDMQGWVYMDAPGRATMDNILITPFTKKSRELKGLKKENPFKESP